jgi:serine/threonine protein kinase
MAPFPMSDGHIRRCPSCGVENAPHVMRCPCGALLAGIDLVSPASTAPAPAPAPVSAPASAPAPAPTHCRFDDCGQPNPPGSTSCQYCDRPLSATASPPAPPASLLNLPPALQARYRIVRPLPTQGAEAELLLVEALGGGPQLVAKIYRQGIHPKQAVQERINRMPLRHRVEFLDTGNAQGYAYELMEFCRHGSWREQMKDGALHEGLLLDFVRELAPALASAHEAGLIHRDLKPENLLLRSLSPLNLVLTDFGSASVLDATQRFTGNARTLPYAAPESLSGVIDAKADYWAFGIMILEGALGRHPFAGLSEAVILHHLTTRSMDLSGVPMPDLCKLLRGLLLRDPARRWGAAEIERWLARDPNLPDPVESHVNSQFRTPYHIAKDICHTPQELAAALARNWRIALADSENGQLLAWFRDVQKDQNVVRLLLEMKFDMQMQVDLRLLKLILYLAPNTAPVWQGAPIDLRAVLSRVAPALQGEREAIDWLDLIYRQRVLDYYAQAGHAGSKQLIERWTLACEQFSTAWAAKLPLIEAKASARGPDEYVNFDDIVYGSGPLERPPLGLMHARLLAVTHDPAWVERLRQRLHPEFCTLLAACPWFAALGEPQTMDGITLLVLEALMPVARQAAERQRKATERQQANAQGDYDNTQRELRQLLVRIHTLGSRQLATPTVCDDLTVALEQLFDLYIKIRAAGRTDPAWQKLDQAAQAQKQTAHTLRKLVDTLSEQHVVNAGWIDINVLAFAGLAAVVLPMLLGGRVIFLVLAAIAGLAAWRLVPTWLMMQQVRALTEKLRERA